MCVACPTGYNITALFSSVFCCAICCMTGVRAVSIRWPGKKNYQLYFVFIFIFALIAVSCSVCLNVMRKYVNDETIRTIHAFEEVSLTNINDHFNLSLRYTKSLAATLGRSVKDVDSVDALSFVKDKVKYTDFDAVVLVGRNGSAVHPRLKKLVNVSGSPSFAKALAGEANISDYNVSSFDGQTYIAINAPIIENGRTKAVLAGIYYADTLGHFISAGFFDGSASSYLINSNGRIIARSEKIEILSESITFWGLLDAPNVEKDDSLIKKFAADLKQKRGGELTFGLSGVKYILSYTPMAYYDWYLVTVIPYSEVAARTQKLFMYTINFVCAVLFLSGLMAAFLFIKFKRGKDDLEKAHKELSFLHDTAAGGIVRCGREGERLVIKSANEGFYEILGYTREAFAQKYGSTVNELFPAQTRAQFVAEIEKQINETGRLRTALTVVAADGALKWLWADLVLIGEDGMLEAFGTVSDITVIRQANENLRIAKEQLDIIQNLTDVNYFEWDPVEDIMRHSGSFEKRFNMPSCYRNFLAEFRKRHFMPDEDALLVIECFMRMKNGARYESFDHRMFLSGGSFCWYRNTMMSIFDENGRTIKVLGVLTNVDTDIRSIKKAEDSARRDPMTGLWNRTATEFMVNEYIALSQGPALFMLTDIDKFKNLNDTMGHLYGDLMIKELTRNLSDIFSYNEKNVVGRVGGDEFVVFLPDCSVSDEVKALIEKMQKNFMRTYSKDGAEYHISCSIGIAKYPENGRTYDTLMANADKTLYTAKNRGRNLWLFYGE